jgi:anti-sigma B factor antagonist
MSNVMDFVDGLGVLEMQSDRRDDRHVIGLAGELDLDGAGRVTQELRRAEATDARQILLDLTGLDFMDSSGVRLILEAHARSTADGGDRLVLTCGPGPARRLFEMTDLIERLPFTS